VPDNSAWRVRVAKTVVMTLGFALIVPGIAARIFRNHVYRPELSNAALTKR
jgi:hypothetical protein